MKKVLIVDDHSIVRIGITALINAHFSPCHVDSTFETETALDLLKKERYNLVILDISMPGIDFSNFFYTIQVVSKNANILVFSMNPENVYARKIYAQGAKGFLNKASTEEEILKAIRLTMNGEKYISQNYLNEILDTGKDGSMSNPFSTLSPRELEVTMHIINGETTQQISSNLSLALSTVSTFKNKIFNKLLVHNVYELQKLAENHGLKS